MSYRTTGSQPHTAGLTVSWAAPYFTFWDHGVSRHRFGEDPCRSKHRHIFSLLSLIVFLIANKTLENPNWSSEAWTSACLVFPKASCLVLRKIVRDWGGTEKDICNDIISESMFEQHVWRSKSPNCTLIFLLLHNNPSSGFPPWTESQCED